MLADHAVPEGLAPDRVAIDAAGFVRGTFTAPELARLATHLAARGPSALATLPLADRLAAWSSTVEAFLDPEAPERRRLFPQLLTTSRLSAEGLCEGLEILLGGVRDAAARALASGIPAGAQRGLAGAILAGNLPGLATQCLLPALLAGRPLLLKSSSAEPLFAPAFLAALVARAPGLADAFAAVSFAGDASALIEAAFAPVERLVVYGGGEAAAELAPRYGSRLISHGPKASVAMIGRGVDPLAVARGLARDIALFDQRGCLSVQAVYVDGDADELGEMLAWALALEHGRLPPGPCAPEEIAAVQQVRAEAELRGVGMPRLALAQGTVIVEPRADFRPSPGLRTVRLHPVPELAGALAALAPWRGRWQGAALAGEAAWRLEGELVALGFSRCALPGALQAADATWANGGVDPRALFA